MIARLLLLAACTSGDRLPAADPVVQAPTGVSTLVPARWVSGESLDSWPGSTRWARPGDDQRARSVELHPAGDWAFVERRSGSELWHLESGRYLALPAGKGWFLDRRLRLEAGPLVLELPLDPTLDPATLPPAQLADLSGAWWVDDVLVVAGRHQAAVLDAATGTPTGTLAIERRRGGCPVRRASWTGLTGGGRAALPWICDAGVSENDPDPTGRFAMDPRERWLTIQRDGEIVQRPLKGAPKRMHTATWSLNGRRLAGAANRWVGVWAVPAGRRIFGKQTERQPAAVSLSADGRTVAWLERARDGGRVTGADVRSKEVLWSCELAVDAHDLTLGPEDGLLLQGPERLWRLDPLSCATVWSIETRRTPPPAHARATDLPESFEALADRRRSPVSWTPDRSVVVRAAPAELLIWDPSVPATPESAPPAPPSGNGVGFAPRVGLPSGRGGATRAPRAGARVGYGRGPRGLEGSDHAEWLVDPDGVERRLREQGARFR